MPGRKMNLRWGVKLLILLLVFSLVPIAVLAWWTSETLEATFRASTLDGMRGLVNAKADAVDQFTEDRRSDVERIGTLVSPRLQRVLTAEADLEELQSDDEPEAPLPQLADAEAIGTEAPEQEVPEDPAAEEQVEPPPPVDSGLLGRRQEELNEASSALRQTLGLILWDQHKFEEILVIDANGRVLASTFEGHEGKSAAGLAYFQSGLRTTYAQPVFMSPITERLTMVISAPIRNEHHQAIGVLAARLNLSRFFRLINDHTGLGETGETIVGKKIGQEVVFMAPTRHDVDAALTRKVPIGTTNSEALQEASRGHSGAGMQTDYRGQCTLVSWQHVPTLDWGLAVKQDCAEAMKPVATAQQRMIGIALTLTVFVLIASLVAARAFVNPLRKLKEAADRISKGDFNVQLDINSRDEIGELADSFERMVAAIKFFREHSRREEEEEAEARALREEEAREAIG